MADSFVDTNVLVYLFSGLTPKADAAEAIVAAGGTISVQVLNELANVCRRKMQLSWAETHACLSVVRRLLTVRDITLATQTAGLALAERYGLSVYDAMIAASALEAGCDRLWSEEMQHGLVIERTLTVANPFR